MTVLFQTDLLEWLCALGLPQYHKQLVSSGYDSMGLVADLTWEELQEIGVNKLGKDCSEAFRLGPPMPPSPLREQRMGPGRWERPLLDPANLTLSVHPSQGIRRSLCWV